MPRRCLNGNYHLVENKQLLTVSVHTLESCYAHLDQRMKLISTQGGKPHTQCVKLIRIVEIPFPSLPPLPIPSLCAVSLDGCAASVCTLHACWLPSLTDHINTRWYTGSTSTEYCCWSVQVVCVCGCTCAAFECMHVASVSREKD